MLSPVTLTDADCWTLGAPGTLKSESEDHSLLLPAWMWFYISWSPSTLQGILYLVILTHLPADYSERLEGETRFSCRTPSVQHNIETGFNRSTAPRVDTAVAVRLEINAPALAKKIAHRVLQREIGRKDDNIKRVRVNLTFLLFSLLLPSKD